MHATQMLKDDHKVILGLFRQLEAAELRAAEMKSGLLRQIEMELEVHTAIEEEIFYPAVREALEGKGSVDAEVAEALEAHDAIRIIFNEIRGVDIHDPLYADRFAELSQLIEVHFSDEEHLLIPMAEREAGESLDALGVRMEQRRLELMRSERYQAAMPERVQNPHGGEQMRKTG